MGKPLFFGRLGYFSFALFLISARPGLAADETFTPPSGGTPIISPSIESDLFITNTHDGDKKMVATEGVPFTQAIELRTWHRPGNAWDFQLTQKIPTPIRKGDVLWMTLWMRATETSSESHEGFSELSVEQSSAPYDKLGVFSFSAGSKWQQFAWSCTAARDYAPGETQICLRGGYAPQVIQIGGFQILDYGASLKASDLPRTRMTYAGMEPDAPWRQAAAARIEKYRKGDLKITVKDSAGLPVTGAVVKIEQVRQAFGFGSCVVASLINGTGPDSDRYREIIHHHFSKVVMENDLKWIPWEQSTPAGHTSVLAAMRWLQDQGIQIRGHNLVWPSWQFLPSDLRALKNDPHALEQRIDAHIREVAGATKGLVTEWDVVNEPYSSHELLDLLPPGAMASWFQLVHQVDPRPVLFLNDFAGLTDLGQDTPHKDAFEKTLRELKAEGAPIGGLGIQAHFGSQLTGPEQIVKELDRWAALGLEIQITEFDLDIEDEDLQGQYTRDFMTAVFSDPAVNALLTWGFWQGADWIPRAALYRRDWSIKPNGEAWNDLVLKQWHTDLTAETDGSGTVSTRGFLGQYQITVTRNGTSKTWPLTLSKDGAVLEAILPAGPD